MKSFNSDLVTLDLVISNCISWQRTSVFSTYNIRSCIFSRYFRTTLRDIWSSFRQSIF